MSCPKSKSVFRKIKVALHEFMIALCAPLWLVFFLLCFVLFVPIYIYRRVVVLYVRRYRKDLGKMVTARSIIMAIDNWHTKPECNIVIWFVLKGNMSVQELQAGFKERVLNLKNPTTSSLIYQELRQYFKNAYGYLFWKWDEHFNLDNHVKICEEVKGYNNGPITEEEMIKINETLLSKPWPMKQSPWSFLLVPNYKSSDKVWNCHSQNGDDIVDLTSAAAAAAGQKGKNGNGLSVISLKTEEDSKESSEESLAVFIVHHGMCDGYSLLKMLVGHLAGESLAKVAKPHYIERNYCAKLVWRTITFPGRVLYDFSKQAIDGYDVNIWHIPEKKLTRNLRLGKSERIPITFIKEIKNAYNVSFSAVLYAAFAGGIRNHFIEEGVPIPEGMHVFIPWPFPNHPNDKLRNHVSGCLGKLPLGKRTTLERLKACHRNLESMRGSTAPLANFYMGIMFGALPNCMKESRKNYHATGIWGNFPGVQKHFSICGREVTKMSYNVTSLHGRTGFTFTVLSFGDYVTFDLTIDEALIPTEAAVKRLIANVHEELDILWRDAAV